MWPVESVGDGLYASKQDCKVFIGGLSWETTDEKLRRYFENYGSVHEAFVSYDRTTGRPRGFGFVVFDDPAVADRVVSLQHTIDRREVEAKKAVPKLEQPVKPAGPCASTRTKKIFVGGLAPSVDEKAFRCYFELYGEVEDAVVMYDHDNKRPRGFGFITFIHEEAVEQVFVQGAIQSLHDKPIEIKRAVPREQMTAVKTPRAAVPASTAQRSPYSSPVFAKVPTTGADSLFSLPSLSRSSYGLQDSPSSGSSRDHGPSIPAVHAPADLLPYQFLDLHASRRHSIDMHGLDRLSSQSVPAHLQRPVEAHQGGFSLFSNSGGIAADRAQGRALHRHSLDSSLLGAPGLYSSRGYADPWAREPELPESLYLPELEQLYLSAPMAGLGHHSLPADFLSISAGQ